MPRAIAKKPVAAKRKAAVPDTTPKRLDRIEEKREESRLNLARVDEKIVASQARTDRLEYRLDEQESDIDSLKSVVGYNAQSVKIAERFVWILLTTLVGFVSSSQIQLW